MSSIGLPVSRLIEVDVVLTPPAAQAPNLNTALIVGSSNVIDVEQRIRAYASISQVATDFGTVAPEYLAAQLYFAQSPQPNLLYIGRWAEVATAGLLEGGAISAANQLPAVWTPVTSGSFFVQVDNQAFAITGLNFSSVANMNAVATVIQTALNTALAGTLCSWDAVNNRLVVTSPTTGILSMVSFMQAPTAVGLLTFAGQPAPADTLVLNGTTITFVNSITTGIQCLIGGTLAATLANLVTLINSSADVQIAKFKSSVISAGGKVSLWAAASGAGGNALTLAKVSTNITLSGATLAGATGTDISAMASGLSTSNGSNIVAGIAAETPVQALAILDNNQFYWYMVMFADLSLTNQNYIDCAAYIEAASNKHIFGITTTDANSYNAQSTTDLGYLLQQLHYNRTFVQYSQNYLACASWLGRAVTVNFAGNSTVINMMYQPEPSVFPENLTTTQANALQAKNINVYGNYNNGTAIIQYGTMASGNYFDVIQDTDWLALDIQTRVFNLLYTATTKIPQTDAGNHLISNAIEASCVAAVNNGTLAPGTWNTNGFGQIKNGDFLPKGYYIYQPPISSQSQADRQARKSVVFQVAAKLAGAINTVDIILNVNQ